ncbi:acyl-CoA thioester hydrolase/BAAT C-terminal domain-containing protein [Acinetobacter sp. V102_4]|uniref:alpha/beta hydrolase n=1 Tax=Acinetobacter sp. V102_4 TaxID=3072984 RepID=UPI00287C4C62|nr:CocE/NonD family hydrolase [Acinetobacter sp. V102_4]MDS7927950.1 acyl-CoA thioester hydrolase/BAAT C-terminal domain-containing protein [Acinetobacter sp. V102_4]
MSKHGNYTKEKVSFDSYGDQVVGDIYKPLGNGPFPTVIILGPYSFQKEQAPTQYATRMADEGYLALAFDPRTVGESGGIPRRLENPKMKNEDVVSAIDYMFTRPDVDTSKIYLLGVCQGGPEMLDIASYEDRVQAVVSVTGYYRDTETDLFMIAAGVTENPFDTATAPSIEEREALLQKRLKRAQEAKDLYETTGEVIYQPLVSPDLGDRISGSNAGLPGPLVWSWYGPWTLKGWENQYAVMSDLDHFSYSTVSGVSKLTKPALIIHSDTCMNPAAARRHYDSIPISDKALIWENGTNHFQYYEQPDVVDRTVGHVTNWFNSHIN